MPALKVTIILVCQPWKSPAYSCAGLEGHQPTHVLALRVSLPDNSPTYPCASLEGYQPTHVPALKAASWHMCLPDNSPTYSCASLEGHQPTHVPALKVASRHMCLPDNSPTSCASLESHQPTHVPALRGRPARYSRDRCIPTHVCGRYMLCTFGVGCFMWSGNKTYANLHYWSSTSDTVFLFTPRRTIWQNEQKNVWSPGRFKVIIKQNNLSLVICVRISLSLGWRKDHLSLQYRSPDESCFVFISYCLMILYHFQLRYMW